MFCGCDCRERRKHLQRRVIMQLSCSVTKVFFAFFALQRIGLPHSRSTASAWPVYLSVKSGDRWEKFLILFRHVNLTNFFFVTQKLSTRVDVYNAHFNVSYEPEQHSQQNPQILNLLNINNQNKKNENDNNINILPFFCEIHLLKWTENVSSTILLHLQWQLLKIGEAPRSLHIVEGIFTPGLVQTPPVKMNSSAKCKARITFFK